MNFDLPDTTKTTNRTPLASWGYSLVAKLVVLITIIVGLHYPLSEISKLIHERDARSHSAKADIERMGGKAQVIVGPYVGGGMSRTILTIQKICQTQVWSFPQVLSR
jgi:inner membrane protein involved in colicin E2 resistance